MLSEYLYCATYLEEVKLWSAIPSEAISYWYNHPLTQHKKTHIRMEASPV